MYYLLFKIKFQLIFIKFIILFLFLIKNVFSLPNIDECIKPIGMESGKIHDEQLSASSAFDPLSTGPINSRLNTESGSGAWCPSSQINATTHEWIQVELNEEYFIVGVRTQGRWDKGRGLEFPSAYMIEYWRPSLGRWARYKDKNGNEIILANTNTQTAILRILDGGIIAKLIRLIPVSETIRTVCLRFEIYGCLYKYPLISYSAPTGSIKNNFDLRDLNYDGWIQENKKEQNINWMRGGIGKLFDGIKGKDNFEENSENWIGWNKNLNFGKYIPLEFIFSKRQNLSAILLYTSNFRKKGVYIFSLIKLYFSPFGGEFSTRIIEKKIPEDIQFENARWIYISIPYRITTKLRIELFFDINSEWILLSEIKFETENISSLNSDKYELLNEDKNYWLSSSSFEDNINDNDYNVDIAEDNNNNLNFWILIENCYILILIIFFGLCLTFIAFIVCLRSIIFKSKRNRNKHNLIITSGSLTSASLTSNRSINNQNNNNSLKNSKSLLLQHLINGTRKKIENKKSYLSSSQSNILLKIPFDLNNDKEQQNELIDIAKLVIKQNNLKKLNENENQYEDPDVSEIYFKMSKNYKNHQKQPLLHYATKDLIFENKINKINNLNLIIDDFERNLRNQSPTTLSQKRYLGTPTIANFPSIGLPPPPLPSLPPPQ